MQHKEPTPEQIVEHKAYRHMGLNDEEFQKTIDILGRKPTYTETGIFSVMWSEHCSYKHSKPVLSKFPTEGPQVLQGPGEGAGIVDIGDNQAVVFKMESHNRPSAVEPYEGAATGVGGILRDVFSMGARPIALLNSLRFGDLKSERTKYLFERAVAGIAGYGNSIGVPTVGGEVVFDPIYQENPLVNAMCVGLIDHDQIQTGVAKGIGNPVIYAGAATGRDGIHGATFASEELTEETESNASPVQAGDPFLESMLLEATLELINSGHVVGIQDMGAAGLTSSSAEMASKAGNGIELNLDWVPQREKDMSAYEMMLSESQERMLVVVKKGSEEAVYGIFEKWGLAAVVIGRVTDDSLLRVVHNGAIKAEIPADQLADDAPVYHMPSKEPAYYAQYGQIDSSQIEETSNYNQTLLDLLGSPNIASKEWVYKQFDSTARADTAVHPGSDAGVVVIHGTRKAIAMSADCNGGYVYLDPYQGGAIAVAEAARNVVCSGATPLAITDNLNFGSPENPEIFWQIEQSAAGISDACRQLDAPVISGNVSLYNESRGEAIYPTPTIGVVGLIKDLDHITTQWFKNEGDIIFVFGDTKAEIGGSEYQKLQIDRIEGRPPQIDLVAEHRTQQATLEAIRSDLIQSAHDCSEGGLAIAIVESCISGGLGAEINITTDLRPDIALFSESQSRIVISVSPENVERCKQVAEKYDVPCIQLGVVGANQVEIRVNENETINQSLSETTKAWKDAIPCMMK